MTVWGCSRPDSSTCHFSTHRCVVSASSYFPWLESTTPTISWSTLPALLSHCWRIYLDYGAWKMARFYMIFQRVMKIWNTFLGRLGSLGHWLRDRVTRTHHERTSSRATVLSGGCLTCVHTFVHQSVSVQGVNCFRILLYSGKDIPTTLWCNEFDMC